ncbi:hypothetical protein CDAR_433291 [Caerostris darwini]|uniref:Uncharacterized protein n=1 Tax=Caerostris darwini TaxID=1538125 RepID=A0AAV4QFZ5_9ARAC|nr:hypothetical protein CDAR_433291 [Caerostris darwini]
MMIIKLIFSGEISFGTCSSEGFFLFVDSLTGVMDEIEGKKPPTEIPIYQHYPIVFSVKCTGGYAFDIGTQIEIRQTKPNQKLSGSSAQ